MTGRLSAAGGQRRQPELETVSTSNNNNIRLPRGGQVKKKNLHRDDDEVPVIPKLFDHVLPPIIYDNSSSGRMNPPANVTIQVPLNNDDDLSTDASSITFPAPPELYPGRILYPSGLKEAAAAVEAGFGGETGAPVEPAATVVNDNNKKPFLGPLKEIDEGKAMSMICTRKNEVVRCDDEKVAVTPIHMATTKGDHLMSDDILTTTPDGMSGGTSSTIAATNGRKQKMTTTTADAMKDPPPPIVSPNDDDDDCNDYDNGCDVVDDQAISICTGHFIRSDEFVTPTPHTPTISSSRDHHHHHFTTPTFATAYDESLTMGVTTSRRQLWNASSSEVFFPERRRSSNNFAIESLTINKLRFDSLTELYGRKHEIRILKQCLERMMSIGHQKKNLRGHEGNISSSQKADESSSRRPKRRRELVMIKGYSGTGKSALASTLRKPVEKLGGLYVDGKFDLYLRDEPLVGILSACHQICGAILALRYHHHHHHNNNCRNDQNPETKFEEIRDQISKQFGFGSSSTELGVLLRFIPVLEEILSPEVVLLARFEADKSTKGQTNEESKNQFNFALRRFIRLIGSIFQPLVIVLDDLQWCDVASLEVLDLLITDRDNPNLMIVGLYRSNEVTEDTHPLFVKTLRDLQSKKEKDQFHVTEIVIGNLDIDSIHRLISDLLSCVDNDDGRTLALADVCLKKTRGNVFFLIRYLCAIKEKMLLQFNIGLLQWTWDIHEIEQQTKATDNVIDLLQTQMLGLPLETRQFLQLCSFLGSTFSKKMASLVWKQAFVFVNKEEEEADNEYHTMQLLESGLQSAEEEGFIEKVDDDTDDDGDASRYRWIHDKIQEASNSLVPQDDRSSFGGRVGRALVSQLNAEELDEAIFIAVNLLNEDPRTDNEEECIELATFNLRAAKKATSLSSFASAANYARKGIDMLPKSSWKYQNELTLELYTVAAEAEVSRGSPEEAEKLSYHVIEQQGIPITSKFRAYSVLMDSVANRDRMLEGLEIGLDLLSQCGCRFPKFSAGITFQTLSGIMKAKSNVKKYCNKETLGVHPTTNDTFRVGVMGILHKIGPYAYMSRTEYLPLAVMRNLFLTTRYGLCEYSASAFAWMGTIFSSVGDIQTAKAYAEQALRILETQDSGITQSLVLCVTYCFTLHWLNPLQQMLKPLLKSYEVGMQTGDTESAGWGIYHYTFIAFQASHQLESLAHDAGVYSRQMWEMGRIKQSTYFNVTQQLCLNLMGHAEDPLVLTGQAMDEEDYTERASGKSIHLRPFLLCHRIILYGYFGAYDQGAQLALQVGDLAKEIPASALVVMCACMNGLSLCHMARETGKQKYKKGAKRFRNRIKTWLAFGNPNLQHWDCLLNAEWAALRGRQHIAKRNYETAIVVAARSGFMQDAGLACERYGEFLIKELKEQEDGMHRLHQAIQYFAEWGAKGKVEQIEKRHVGLWPKPGVIVTRSSASTNLHVQPF